MALLALLPSLLAAQPTGSIAGRVVDSTGSALPGATVSLIGAGPAAEGPQITAADGSFAFENVPAGDYLVEAALSGFEPRGEPVSVEADAVARLDLILEISRLMESITVVAEEPRSFATNVVAEPMVAQQSPISSVLAVVDNVPGVSIQEGDPYGTDDWSTSISMRGFQVNLDEAQIGTTIDGMPNGTSDYWSGSKANRFVDPANMGGVTVSQGTADIASRSIEALGGTLDFTTDEPEHERKFTAAVDLGSDDGQRFYLRVDTGHLFGREVRAWVSAVHQESSDWVQGFARSERDHLAGKIQAEVGRLDLSAYVSYDDTDNASYQRLTSEAEYRSDPRWDRLTDTWTDTPWVNQLYRLGWAIPRQNAFGYVKADFAATDVLSITGGAYYHQQWGRGDWLPPYLVDVTADGGGAESELASGFTALGGSPLGQVQFVDPAGVPLAPRPGCVSSLQFPYGGAGAEFDPACHPADAIPVQSYRHSHYGKERVGLTLDGDWFGELAMGGNRLRAGLWAEDGRRDLGRDWHKILDVRVSHRYDDTPYWRQYDWEFPQSIVKWYVEDTLFAGPLAINAGVRQYLVEVGRRDHFGETAELSVSSDSDLLLSGGFTYTAPVSGLELFAGYAQNFKSLSDRLLEVPGRSLEGLEPETADNLDVGLRYTGDRLAATATYYRIDFQNRIFFLSPQTAAGPNYLIAGGGSYFNAGGIDSRGVELSATLRATDSTSLYTAWTRNDATYVGTGDPLVSAAQGIPARQSGRRRPAHARRGLRRSQRGTGRRRHLGEVHRGAGHHAGRVVERGRLLAPGRLLPVVGRPDQPAVSGSRSGADRQQPARPGLPRHHRRAGRVPGRPAHRLAERDCVVLSDGTPERADPGATRRPADSGGSGSQLATGRQNVPAAAAGGGWRRIPRPRPSPGSARRPPRYPADAARRGPDPPRG